MHFGISDGAGKLGASAAVRRPSERLSAFRKVLSRPDGAVLALFGGWLLYEVSKIPSTAATAAISPRLYPMGIAGVLVCLGVAVQIRDVAVSHGVGMSGEDAAQDGQGHETVSRAHRLRQAGVLGALFAYPFAVATLGYVVATAVLILCLLLVMDMDLLKRPRSWNAACSLGICIVTPLILGVLFGQVLGVALPAGVLGFT